MATGGPPERRAQAQLRRHVEQVVVGQVQRGQAQQAQQPSGVHASHLVVSQQDGFQRRHVVQNLREGLEPAAQLFSARPPARAKALPCELGGGLLVVVEDDRVKLCQVLQLDG